MLQRPDLLNFFPASFPRIGNKVLLLVFLKDIANSLMVNWNDPTNNSASA